MTPVSAPRIQTRDVTAPVCVWRVGLWTVMATSFPRTATARIVRAAFGLPRVGVAVAMARRSAPIAVATCVRCLVVVLMCPPQGLDHVRESSTMPPQRIPYLQHENEYSVENCFDNVIV